MFETMEGLVERLLAAAPAEEELADPWRPLPGGAKAVVTELVELQRVTAAAEGRSMVLMAELCGWVQQWEGHDSREPAGDLGADDVVAAEVAPALHLAPVTAAIRVRTAVELRSRLSGTLAAMCRGELDLGRVLAIRDATSDLEEDVVGKVEKAVLPGAAKQTAGELRRALSKAVIAADPDAAERRRKTAIRDRSVSRWTRRDGTGVIDAVISAVDSGEIYELIDEIARQTKTSDEKRSMDARRADAFVLALLGREPTLGPEDEPPPGPPPPTDRQRDRWPLPDDDAATRAEPDWTPPADEPATASEPANASEPVTSTDVATARETPTGAEPVAGAASAAGAEPAVPTTTANATGAASATSTGAESAAGAETSSRAETTTQEPCFSDGRQTPVEPADLDERFPPEEAADPGVDPVPFGPTRSERISDLARLALSAMTSRRPPRLPWVAIHETVNADGATVLVGELQGYGPITADYAGHLLATEHARAAPQPSGRTPTPRQAGTHDPPGWLAEDIRARDGTCRFPGCCRDAQRVDLDHTVAFPRGPTVRTNLGALCRRHHRLKTFNFWQLEQPREGILVWTSTLTGRRYTTHPRGTTGDWRGADPA